MVTKNKKLSLTERGLLMNLRAAKAATAFMDLQADFHNYCRFLSSCCYLEPDEATLPVQAGFGLVRTTQCGEGSSALFLARKLPLPADPAPRITLPAPRALTTKDQEMQVGTMAWSTTARLLWLAIRCKACSECSVMGPYQRLVAGVLLLHVLSAYY